MKINKGIKLALILLAVYVGIVVLFESSLGFFQPEAGNTIVIETFDAGGNGYTRVVSLLTSAGNEYVAVNHWPRAWYGRLKETPRIGVVRLGGQTIFGAGMVSGVEHDQVQADNPTPFAFRFLTGFPPRYFVRLDPQ
jgi:hypothetical protein